MCLQKHIYTLICDKKLNMNTLIPFKKYKIKKNDSKCTPHITFTAVARFVGFGTFFLGYTFN